MFVVRLVTRLFVAVGLGGFFAALLLGALPPASDDPAADQTAGASTATTRAAMRGVFTAFTTVYSYSLDMDYFSDRRNRGSVTAALEALVANTAELRDHGGGLDPSFGYLRKSLASDAEEALKRYNKQEYLGSQFVLNKLMENCATCHARLPSDQTFDVGTDFLKKAGVRALGPVDRVNVEIAARQFGNALATYEQIIGDTRIPAEGLLLTGAFEGYLKICIGVKNDTGRPVRTLETFVKRDDIPAELRQQAESWIGDLRALDFSKVPGRELDYARQLVGDQAVLKRPTSDRPDLVRMVAANAFLRRYVQSLSSYDSDAAEVYYLLAVTESRISRSYWIAEVDFLLEQAVRSAPKTEFARKALAVLEERSKNPQPATAYEGQEVPTVDIEELRNLVEG